MEHIHIANQNLAEEDLRYYEGEDIKRKFTEDMMKLKIYEAVKINSEEIKKFSSVLYKYEKLKKKIYVNILS